jgi:hypothetical protein
MGKNNTIVEGHERLEALKQLGYISVDCIRLDHLTDEERKAYTLAHNKINMNTGFDKGKLVADDDYIELLKGCNCVVQISMVCSKYDKIEKGCPTFEERLQILEKVSNNVKRTIVRVQPYMHEVYKQFRKIQESRGLWCNH